MRVSIYITPQYRRKGDKTIIVQTWPIQFMFTINKKLQKNEKLHMKMKKYVYDSNNP